MFFLSRLIKKFKKKAAIIIIKVEMKKLYFYFTLFNIKEMNKVT